MPSVQVKEFPQELYDQLKSFAEQNHRSMAQQLVVAAEHMLHEQPTRTDSTSETAPNSTEAACNERIAKRKALFERIDASIEASKANGSWANDVPDAATVIRQMRETRDAHMHETLDIACEGSHV